MGVEFEFCDKHTLARELGLPLHTIKRLRVTGQWCEGVHWVRVSQRLFRYNLPLCKHWLATRGGADHGERVLAWLRDVEGVA